MKLLSDQIDERELRIILRELEKVIVNKVEGDVVEFGCFVGTTSVPMGKRLMTTDKQLYVYDSFEGLPEKTDEDISPIGEMFKPGELFASKKELTKNFKQAGVPLPRITKGWFSDVRQDQVPNKIAFAYLDGDYYASIKDPLTLIAPLLQPGACVVVDDYMNEQLPGAARAVDEWLATHPSRVHAEHSLAIIQLI
ncbi:MAG TPA: TylF/MycF/NovP-related O-methyltransferase [Candidatus Saccharimonadales bacterium]|nr:TylF/MycF/NovP-related O-methyltransferase [Candidatus Saccharimonadales bacterium]